jgi:hypothetical protein
MQTPHQEFVTFPKTLNLKLVQITMFLNFSSFKAQHVKHLIELLNYEWSLPYSENMEIWHDHKRLTWCKDLSAFILFLLADDVTLSSFIIHNKRIQLIC